MTSNENDFQKTVDWLLQKARAFFAMRLVLGMVFALVGGVGGYLGATYNENAKRLHIGLSDFEGSRKAWIETSADVFTNAHSLAVDNPRLPNKADIQKIRSATNELITKLNSVPTPTSNIEVAAYNFNSSLFGVMRELGKYNGSPEATTRIIEASQVASNTGEAHRAAVQDFLSSTFLQLKGAI